MRGRPGRPVPAMAVASSEALRATDGVPLHRKLRRVERIRELRAAALMAPALLFLLVAFALPIGLFLFRAAENSEIPAVLPRTVAALAAWDGQGLPDEAAFRALALDLGEADRTALAVLARRLNYHEAGYRSVILLSARKLPEEEPASWRDAVIAANQAWGERAIWATIRQEFGPVTPYYLLASLDLQRDADGAIVGAPAERAIYQQVFGRTFWISLIVTLTCLLLGYPIAYLLASSPVRISNWLMLLVLLPFWTSLLVRTLAWLIILQKEGVANQALVVLGLVPEPIQLIRTRFAVYRRDDPHPAAVHGAAAVQRHEAHLAVLHARRRLARRHPLAAFLTRLPAADRPRHRRRRAARLHPGARLLHHAGAGRRRGPTR